MKNSILSILAVAAAVNAGKVVSTRYETQVYTITSCPPEYTNCPAKKTSTVHTYTTECDETEKPKPTYPPVTYTKYPVHTKEHTKEHTKVYTKEYTKEHTKVYTKEHTKPYTKEYPTKKYATSTVYETKTYTIKSCAPTVTYCPVGHVTTTVIASTTVCPIETGKPYPPKDDEHKPYPPPKEDEHKPYPPKEDEHKPYPPPKEDEHKPYPPKEDEHKPYPPPKEDEHKPYPPKEDEHKPYPPPKEDEHKPYPPPKEDEHKPYPPAETTTYGEHAYTKPYSPPAETHPAGPVYSSITTIKTGPYGTGAVIPVPTGGYTYPSKNQTVEYTGSANIQRAGGLLLAAGLVVVALL